MYTLWWLGDERNTWAGGGEDKYGAVQLAKVLIKHRYGILIVQDSAGDTIFEALNDGIEIVTVQPVEIVGVMNCTGYTKNNDIRKRMNAWSV